MVTIPRPEVGIIPLCERPAWKALRQHYAKIQNARLRQLFRGGSPARRALRV